ncbi:Rossmann-like and DUF2520 domain-containing protein [Dysgonomonas macrotermitis]|uniref:Predicted oxidoreductase, contains short-chain dehydrogenase (SDR) and DUF2520 domains n=1 Tax=Dysgonomonas macrotermitis TaxID=1346286 RepID=A0A1M5AEN3_9BACT|nr:Rossmann-like and DUF2520 domain-containing protein [Dysgonomonas macrotermitis]SHF28362.1 Predicted oxidoreductase, contains short-chain dehydrogenase (SDR) and DUF2520 domains [Dysgonomonas macrotermitis]
MKIVFIGAGRLATHLAKSLYEASHIIVQVYSRTLESASLLAGLVNSNPINKLTEIYPDADIYIFSVNDSVLEDLLNQIPENNGIWLHTAGSLPLGIFEGHNKRYGVIYPLQTFSKDRNVDFEKIPLFIEANNDPDIQLLTNLGKGISQDVYTLSSEKRQYIHLTGVFACNFVNQMYAISDTILKEEGIPFQVLLPLIDETAAKVHDLSPKEAQTGPAIRYDTNIINKHLTLIKDEKLKNIYRLISEYIHESNK